MSAIRRQKFLSRTRNAGWRNGSLVLTLMTAAVACQCGWCDEVKAANSWANVDRGTTGDRSGAVLLWASDLKRMLRVGPADGAACVQLFDAAAPAWSKLTSA